MPNASTIIGSIIMLYYVLPVKTDIYIILLYIHVLKKIHTVVYYCVKILYVPMVFL